MRVSDLATRIGQMKVGVATMFKRMLARVEVMTFAQLVVSIGCFVVALLTFFVMVYSGGNEDPRILPIIEADVDELDNSGQIGNWIVKLIEKEDYDGALKLIAKLQTSPEDRDAERMLIARKLITAREFDRARKIVKMLESKSHRREIEEELDLEMSKH